MPASEVCNDDLDFMEEINQELQLNTINQEGVIKRSVLNKLLCQSPFDR